MRMRCLTFPARVLARISAVKADFILPVNPGLDGYSQKSAQATPPCIKQQAHNRYGNVDPLSIAYAIRLGLGPTNPGMTIIAQETLLFRCAGFSPAYVTHSSILTCSRSTAPLSTASPQLQRSSTTDSGDNLRFSPDAHRQSRVAKGDQARCPLSLLKKIGVRGP
jgi:hypothetical protein